MIRSICFAMTLFLSTWVMADEHGNRTKHKEQALLDAHVKVTLVLVEMHTSVSTIKKEFTIVGEGKEHTEKRQDGTLKSIALISWNIEVRGHIIEQSAGGMYTIQLQGQFLYVEESESVDESPEKNHEQSQFLIEMAFEAGTRLKPGEEKIVASKDGQQLKVIIEVNE